MVISSVRRTGGEGGNRGCQAVKNGVCSEEEDARLALEWLGDMVSCVA